jgi:hypothetical protein
MSYDPKTGGPCAVADIRRGALDDIAEVLRGYLARKKEESMNRDNQPMNAELARKAALFREGTKRIYEGQGDRADMWFFELFHFLGDVQEALTPKGAE